jgi:hypothetical protein
VNDNNNATGADSSGAIQPSAQAADPETLSQASLASAPAVVPAATRPSRKFLRANVTWRAAIQINHQPQPIKVVNVSEGGIGVLTDIALPMGQSFQMMLQVPIADDLLRQEQVMLTAKVVHSVISMGMYRVNMQIVSISEAHGSLIRAWVSTHGKSA